MPPPPAFFFGSSAIMASVVISRPATDAAFWIAARSNISTQTTIAQCLNGGYGWLQVKCHRCETEASIPLEHVRRPRDTPIWKLEAALKCRSCRTPRYAPPVHMIRLTEERQTAPYIWVHPDDDDR